jgi:hypothetical protein
MRVELACGIVLDFSAENWFVEPKDCTRLFVGQTLLDSREISVPFNG